jgi:protein-disulfide isomerase
MRARTKLAVAGIIVLIAIVGGYFVYHSFTGYTVYQLQGSKFEQYASSLGLNTEQFDACLSSGKYAADVQNDFNDGRLYGVEGTPTIFINDRKLVGALPLSEFQAAVDAELANPTKNVGIRTGSNPPLGSTNSSVNSVTIVVFSDYQCPYCARVEPTLKQLLQQNEGKIKIYFRDFPLSSIHPFAEKAAEASRCAGEQGKYWEYHDMLFQKQNEWASE